MNTLYIDCRMGISGIKLLGALVDMMEQPYEFIRQFNNIGFEGIRAERRVDSAGGVSGTRIDFTRIEDENDPYADEIDDDDERALGERFAFGRKKNNTREHTHRRNPQRTLSDVKNIIDELSLSGKVRKRAADIFETIAAAASKTHGKSIEEVSLHRAGSRDVIASVVGVCIILEDMKPGRIIASPVNVGTGYISGGGGSTSIPTPTVKELLGEMPYMSGKEEGELCTLEGAAILRMYATEFLDAPEIAVLKTGNGIGSRSYKTGPNCTRVSVGREIKTSANATVTELRAALFNDSADVLRMTGQRLAELGVTEAYTIPATSLEGGSGVVLKCVCSSESADDAAAVILKNTSALFVQRSDAAAYKMELVAETKDTRIGEVAVKRASGFGVSKVVIDSSAIEKMAMENNISAQEAWYRLRKEL